MSTDQQTAKSALAGITDAELRALIDATSGAPPLRPAQWDGGSVPLSVLEANVDAWIAAERKGGKN